jgi:transposase
MGETRRRFSREFKLEAVRLMTEEGRRVAEVARDLDVSPRVLRRWRQQVEADSSGAFPGHGSSPSEEDEVRRLRRELARVRQERDSLKIGSSGNTGS